MNVVLNIIPFIAVAMIWTLRKLLERQVEDLGRRLQSVQEATSALNISATTASNKIRDTSQTAAEGLALTAGGAANDVAAATDGMSRAATDVQSALTAATMRLRDEAEIARQKLEAQSDRLRNEIERLAEDIGARTLQMVEQARPTPSVELQDLAQSARHVILDKPN